MLFRVVLCISCALVLIVVGLRLWQEHSQMARDKSVVSQLQGNAWAVYPNGRATIVGFGAPERVNDTSIPLILKLESVWHLDISNSKISDDGFLNLVRMPCLSSLVLVDTGITNDAIGEFVRQRPDVDIVRQVDGWSRFEEANQPQAP